jgi:hypothetical protein
VMDVLFRTYVLVFCVVGQFGDIGSKSEARLP